MREGILFIVCFFFLFFSLVLLNFLFFLYYFSLDLVFFNFSLSFSFPSSHSLLSFSSSNSDIIKLFSLKIFILSFICTFSFNKNKCCRNHLSKQQSKFFLADFFLPTPPRNQTFYHFPQLWRIADACAYCPGSSLFVFYIISFFLFISHCLGFWDSLLPLLIQFFFPDVIFIV